MSNRSIEFFFFWRNHFFSPFPPFSRSSHAFSTRLQMGDRVLADSTTLEQCSAGSVDVAHSPGGTRLATASAIDGIDAVVAIYDGGSGSPLWSLSGRFSLPHGARPTKVSYCSIAVDCCVRERVRKKQESEENASGGPFTQKNVDADLVENDKTNSSPGPTRSLARPSPSPRTTARSASGSKKAGPGSRRKEEQEEIKERRRGASGSGRRRSSPVAAAPLLLWRSPRRSTALGSPWAGATAL